MDYNTRMDMIRKASDRFNATLKRSHDVRKSETSMMDKYDNGDNINAWTDSEKYVDEYYGDRAREQSSYESEWN
jgi:antibiotic biosynthesis monooxygenase (ABM) superfamily enzyme